MTKREILLMGGAVLILAAGAVFFGFKQTPQENATDADGVLRIYRNEKLGFEFRYPDSITVHEEDYSSSFPGHIVLQLTKGEKGFLTIDVNEPGTGFEGWEMISRTSSTVEGVKVDKQVFIATDDRARHILYQFVEGGNEFLLISGEGSEQEMDAVVATFKFLRPATSIEYRNEQYGFSMMLPESWKGYTVADDTWTGTSIDPGNEGYRANGVRLFVNNPKGEKWQEIPVMVFTLDQWKLVDEYKISVSAAPFNPSELGRNSKYVFALPPRWVGYADLLGQDEAQAIVATFKAF